MVVADCENAEQCTLVQSCIWWDDSEFLKFVIFQILTVFHLLQDQFWNVALTGFRACRFVETFQIDFRNQGQRSYVTEPLYTTAWFEQNKQFGNFEKKKTSLENF